MPVRNRACSPGLYPSTGPLPPPESRDIRLAEFALRKQPKTKAEAVRWSQELAAAGRTLSVGLLQVNTEDSPYPVEWLLDPCHNLQEGWRIFAEAYRHEAALFGPGQQALIAAFGMYNAGSALPGLRNGYFFSILRNSY